MASVGDATNRAAAFVGKMSMKGIDTDLKFEAKQSGNSTHVYVKTGASWLGIAAKLGISSAVKERNEMRAEAFKQIKQDFAKTYGPEITNKIFPTGEGAKSISVGQLKGFYELAERMQQNEGTTSALLLGDKSGAIDVADTFEKLKSQGTGSDSPVGSIQERAQHLATESSGQPLDTFKDIALFVNENQALSTVGKDSVQLKAEITDLQNKVMEELDKKPVDSEKLDGLNKELEKAKSTLRDVANREESLKGLQIKYPDGPVRTLMEAFGKAVSSADSQNKFNFAEANLRPGNKAEDIFFKNLTKLNDPQYASVMSFKSNALNQYPIMPIQYATRIPLLMGEIMKRLDPPPTTEQGWTEVKQKLAPIADEIMRTFSTQLENYRTYSSAVSDPRLTDGMTDLQKAQLKQLGETMTAMTKVMTDPDGPIQGFLSFATIAASDPKQAVAMLQVGKDSVQNDIDFAEKLTGILSPKTDDAPVLVKSDDDPTVTVDSGVKPDDSGVKPIDSGVKPTSSDDPPTTTVTSDPPPIQVSSPPPPPLTTGIEFLSDLGLGDAVTKRLSDGVKTGSLQERDLIFAFGKLTNDPRGQFTPLDIIRGMDLSKAATDEFIYRALTGGFDMDAGKMMFQLGDYGTDKLGGRDAAPFQKIDDAVRLTASLTKEQGDQLKVDLMTGRLTPQKLDDSLRAALFGSQFAPIRG